MRISGAGMPTSLSSESALAGAGLADHAEHFARSDVERHVINRGQDAAPGRKLDFQIADAEDDSHRSFGFNASRSQSPNRFTASTSAASVMPGKIAIHHSPANRYFWPIWIKVPSEGWVEGRPSPRNDSVASVMIASARLMVAMTSTGPTTFGSTWRNSILTGRIPIRRAAST